MAPAVLRMITPEAETEHAQECQIGTRQEKRRAARPVARVWPTGALPERMARPVKKQAKVRISPTTREMAAITATLAPRNSGRRGVAAREERMVPLLYSPVIMKHAEHPDGQRPEGQSGQGLVGGVEPVQ